MEATPSAFKVKYFEYIPAVPRRDMILTRVGYRKKTTVLDEKYTNLVEEGIRLSQLLCSMKGAYGRFAVAQRESGRIKLENGAVLESESLEKLLCKSSEVVLMSATAGREVTERITHEVAKGNPALGIILDSAASQTADAGLDWMMEFLNKMLAREGKKLTKMRYSPGYGDLPLSYQKIIYDILGLGRLGIELTEKFMLVPEKSVIAIAGIEHLDIGKENIV